MHHNCMTGCALHAQCTPPVWGRGYTRWLPCLVDATLLSTFWAGYIAPEVIQVAMLPSGDVRSTWDQKHQHYGAIPAAVILLCGSMGIKGMPQYCSACTLKAPPSATKLCFNGLSTLCA